MKTPRKTNKENSSLSPLRAVSLLSLTGMFCLLLSSCGAPGTGAHIADGFNASDGAPDAPTTQPQAQDPHKIFDPETNGLLDQLHPDRSDDTTPAPSPTPADQHSPPANPGPVAAPTPGAEQPPHMPPPPDSFPSTPEPTPVATPENTPQPTPEVKPPAPTPMAPEPVPPPQPTPQPTPPPKPQPPARPTPQSTPNAKPTVTPSPTAPPLPRPTPQPTPKPTPQATPQPTPEFKPTTTPRPTPVPTPRPTVPAPKNTPTNGSNGHGQPNQKPVTAIRGYWEGRSPDGAEWTRETLTAISTYGPDLIKRVPTDITNFCPNYAALDLRGRYDFWVKFISAVAKAESDFKPADHYQEKFNNSAGDPVISRGLLQISMESSQGYHCPISVEADLNDPKLNIQCGVMIMEKWVTADGVIAERDAEGNFYGAARYWGVLRVTNHNLMTIEAVLQHSPGCR